MSERLGDGCAVVSGAIINDDDFDRGRGLALHAINGCGQVTHSVVNRNDDPTPG